MNLLFCMSLMNLKKKISLDTLVGRALKIKIYKKNEMICTKTLYHYVDLGLLEIDNIDLPLKLRCSTKPKRIRKNKRNQGKSIKNVLNLLIIVVTLVTGKLIQ